MPNPTKISLPRIDYHFEESACEQVLTVMLNKVDKDYSTHCPAVACVAAT